MRYLDNNNVEVLQGATAKKPYNITAAGAIPVTESLIYISTTGVTALTLADGLTDGQEIEILMVVDGGTATLTPASLAGYSTIAFADALDCVKLRWVQALDSGNGQYVVVFNTGATLA